MSPRHVIFRLIVFQVLKVLSQLATPCSPAPARPRSPKALRDLQAAGVFEALRRALTAVNDRWEGRTAAGVLGPAAPEANTPQSLSAKTEKASLN